MGKIKIVGMDETITVPDEELESFYELRRNGEIKENELISLGTFRGYVNQIKTILLEDRFNINAPNEHNKKMLEYYSERDEILSWDSQTRADKLAWISFSLFYYGIYDKKPDEEMKPEVIVSAKEFFDKNPFWAKVSVKVWMDYLKLDKKFRIDSNVFRIFERMEQAELEDIKQGITFKNFGIKQNATTIF